MDFFKKLFKKDAGASQQAVESSITTAGTANMTCLAFGRDVDAYFAMGPMLSNEKLDLRDKLLAHCKVCQPCADKYEQARQRARLAEQEPLLRAIVPKSVPLSQSQDRISALLSEMDRLMAELKSRPGQQDLYNSIAGLRSALTKPGGRASKEWLDTVDELLTAVKKKMR